MNDDHIISPNEPSKSSSLIWIVGSIILLIGVGIFSYYLGTRNSIGTIDSTPKPEPLTNISDTPTPTIVSEVAISPSGVVSPTKKPTTAPSATPTPTPIAKTKILGSTKTLDGFRSSNNGGNQTLEIRAGRNENLVTRGFVSFDLSELPAGAQVVEATLRLYQSQIIGNPYGPGGNLKLDHLNFGDSLESTDYASPALSSSFVTLTSNAILEWKDAIVTNQLKDDLSNARSRSQFRIHFVNENTGGTITGDFTYFESADNNMGTGNTPQLVVKYN